MTAALAVPATLLPAQDSDETREAIAASGSGSEPVPQQRSIQLYRRSRRNGLSLATSEGLGHWGFVEDD